MSRKIVMSTACLALIICVAPATAQDEVPDVSKSIIETPVENLIAGKASSTTGMYQVAQDPADTSKLRIERPLEQLVIESRSSSAASSTDQADEAKGAIELPVESIVAERSPAVSHDLLAGFEGDAMPGNIRGDEENPLCEPGQVNWHESFETACATARDSGKPVLLFQLLGRLDQRFT